MKVAVFNTNNYERKNLDKFNTGNKHQLTYFDVVLNKDSTSQTIGFDSVCVLLSDTIDETVIDKPSANNVNPHCT